MFKEIFCHPFHITKYMESMYFAGLALFIQATEDDPCLYDADELE